MHSSISAQLKVWVTERRYNQRNLDQSVNNFLRERDESLDWLISLSAPNWQATYDTQFGQITAGVMSAAWMAHDLQNMRQLVELHWVYTARLVYPHRVDYAGSW